MQRRLGAGRGEADALGRRHQPLHGLRPGDLERMAGGKVRAAGERRLRGVADLRMGVAEQERAVAAVVVDVAVAAIDVPLMRALGALDVEAVGLEMAAVVGDAAREQLARLGGQARRARRPLAPGGLDGQIGQGMIGHDPSMPGDPRRHKGADPLRGRPRAS